MFWELWQYGFFQRALGAGLILGVAAAILGLFLILRKDAMLGHGLTHIAFAGVALALFFDLMPFPVALLAAAAAAFFILKIRERAGLYGDTAVAIFSSLGLAAGIVLASVARNFNVNLLSFLFGNILAVNDLELYGAIILALGVILALVLFYYELLFITFDEESARAAGLAVGRLDALLALLTAVTVVIGMKIVGLLLVSALLVLPGAAALQLAGSFRRCVFLAALFGAISVLAGLFLAAALNWPASGAIVLSSGAIFLLAATLRRLRSA